MRTLALRLSVALTGLLLAGCTASRPSPSAVQSAVAAALTPTVVQVNYSAVETMNDALTATPVKFQQEPPSAPARMDAELSPTTGVQSQVLGLPDLIALTLDRNPRLGQVRWAVDTARGRAIQAGLYPNPTVNVTGNELADRTGPSGIWSVYTAQEIVRGDKLDLSQAAALREVDQASLKLMAERYQVFTEVRQAYFEAVTLQRRAEILRELVKLASESTANAERLLKAKEAAELDVVQLEVDLERYRAELDATERALPAAYRKLATTVGIQELPISSVIGNLDAVPPDYDLDQLRLYLLGIHPERRSAQVGVERAQLLLRRATVESIPNLTVGAGYTYQGQNRSNDWDIGVALPIPLWDKNQGNIAAARAQVCEARNQVGRVENDLVSRLATAYSTYAAARERVLRYKTAILPRAQKTHELSLTAYQGGQFEYLRVLQSQRAVVEANLELVRAQGEMWRAASEIAGLMLEDEWPSPPGSAPLEMKL